MTDYGKAGYSTAASAIKPEKIHQLAMLRSGWDLYGAEPITTAALDVLHALAVVPTVDGGVQVEWHVNGEDVEIAVAPDGAVEWFSIDRRSGNRSTVGDET